VRTSENSCSTHLGEYRLSLIPRLYWPRASRRCNSLPLLVVVNIPLLGDVGVCTNP
jgi:hypothetical protein